MKKVVSLLSCLVLAITFTSVMLTNFSDVPIYREKSPEQVQASDFPRELLTKNDDVNQSEAITGQSSAFPKMGVHPDSALAMDADGQVDEATKKNLLANFYRTPMHFIANQGQLDRDVVYYAKTDDGTVYCTEYGLVFGFADNTDQDSTLNHEEDADETRWTTISIKFPEHVRVRPEAREQLPGKVNYLIGNEQDTWHTDVPTYEEIVYPEVYDGIDLVYNGDRRRLKYTFYLQPGAKPEQIEMIYEGIDRLSVDSDTGELIAKKGSGEMRDAAPTAYQMIDGIKKEIDVLFHLIGERSVGIAVGDYDPAFPLVIDPVYSTYLGGSDFDRGYAIAVDDSGCA